MRDGGREVHLTPEQQDGIGDWIRASGHLGPISLEHPEWLGSQYVQVKLYDDEGGVADSATFFFNGQRPPA
jgi:hypothetical protein